MVTQMKQQTVGICKALYYSYKFHLSLYAKLPTLLWQSQKIYDRTTYFYSKQSSYIFHFPYVFHLFLKNVYFIAIYQPNYYSTFTLQQCLNNIYFSGTKKSLAINVL